MSAYTLNTRSSLQTKLHLTATGQSFTKNFRLLALVGVKSLTIMPAIFWLIQARLHQRQLIRQFTNLSYFLT